MPYGHADSRRGGAHIVNERATIAALVILLAAGGLMQALSPAVQALAGRYEAVLSTPDGDVHCELSLATDATAMFRTTPPAGRKEPAQYSGSWIADGGTVQLVLANPDDPEKPVAVTLEPGADTLVVKDVEGRKSPYVGLTFERSKVEPSVVETKKQENS